MNHKLITFSLIVLVALAACKKKQPDPPVLSTDKAFISFTLEKELNPVLSETVSAEIGTNEILLHIPKIAQREELIASFEYKGITVFLDTTEQVSGISSNFFNQPLSYVIHAEDSSKTSYSVTVTWVPEPGPVLPHIFIQLYDDHQIGDINKENYITGYMEIDGKGKYDMYEGELEIKGRGNNTWTLPKKPYRLKLTEKASLLDLPAYKDWVLLAEYLDGTMLYNSIPFKTGHLLDIPYTNHMFPVELTINGEYQGVYTFTENKDVGEDRIDIGADGVLLEMDSSLDEDWCFVSDKYELPVMIQNPKSKNITEELFNEIKDDFEQFEALLFEDDFPNNEYLNYFDDLAFVNYMIVHQLTLNQEINIPRSTYINRPVGEKYNMGIIWDFDWGFGYSLTREHFDMSAVNAPLLGNQKPGSLFFQRLMSDPHMKNLFKDRWNWFKTNKYKELKEYVSEYAFTIQPALAEDHALWGERGSTGNTEQDLQKVLDWLDARVSYIDGYVSDF
ncbi:MAG: CotH kinase family protein [Bacteroidales bacterium]|jgi:hypothetical protein|nr:CotH kinase family protein [Bacteroidales bacterium]MDD3700264.1 CotH kinase family protein [Bacteroidales bacterium]MDY0368494.1 CotH kinase family protein [Bacteroidales bacterium]